MITIRQGKLFKGVVRLSFCILCMELALSPSGLFLSLCDESRNKLSPSVKHLSLAHFLPLTQFSSLSFSSLLFLSHLTPSQSLAVLLAVYVTMPAICVRAEAWELPFFCSL